MQNSSCVNVKAMFILFNCPSVFQVTCNNAVRHITSEDDWHLEIYGLEACEIPLLDEKIPTLVRKISGVLSIKLLKDNPPDPDPDTLAHLSQFHPPMVQVTKVLNRLNGIGFKVVSSTNLSSYDRRHCIIWTLER